MIARIALLVLLPVTAVIALTQRRRLMAVIGMSLFSFLLAVVYVLLRAPDVALTEAAIGAGLVAAIYVLALRRTGRLTVVADEAPHLLTLEGGRVDGLEYEILKGFSRHLGLDLSVQFVPYRDVAALVQRGEADIGAGGRVFAPGAEARATREYLETALFTIAGRAPAAADREPIVEYEGYFSDLEPRRLREADRSLTLDLARFLGVRAAHAPGASITRHPHRRGYAFLVSERRRGLRAELDAYLERLRSEGELDWLIRRFLS